MNVRFGDRRWNFGFEEDSRHRGACARNDHIHLHQLHEVVPKVRLKTTRLMLIHFLWPLRISYSRRRPRHIPRRGQFLLPCGRELVRYAEGSDRQVYNHTLLKSQHQSTCEGCILLLCSKRHLEREIRVSCFK